jgi:hypothetical protein
MGKNPTIESLILTIRGQRVILAADLAGLYGVATKRLNEQVRRNAERFPGDFVFRLSHEEFADLKSHGIVSGHGHAVLRSQNVTLDALALRSQNATLGTPLLASQNKVLKPGPLRQVPSLCLYRAWRDHGRKCSKQPGSGGHERLCGPGVRANAREARRQCSYSQAAGRDRQKAAGA